jgi:predicted PurR-regulated permease PerM
MFLTLLLLVTAVFFGLISSFLMACFWAAIFAILFQGVNEWLIDRLKGRRNLAALLTCLLIVAAVVLPIGLLSIAVVQESTVLFEKLEAGDISLDDVLTNIRSRTPMVDEWLGKVGMTLEDVRVKIEGAVTSTISLIGRRTLHYTQGFIGLIVEFFLMLYLLYFWVRDGEKMLLGIRNAIPVGQEIETLLFKRFAQVSRATLRGTVIVAMCQGLMGGILFGILDIQGAVLWGVLMGVLSLLPVGGSAIIWAPTAFILFAQGHVVDAVIIVVVGTLGIGLIDNILRPILVGREAKMPDYLVLLATIGGLAWFGLSGFIIGPVIAALFITCWEITGVLFGGKE